MDDDGRWTMDDRPLLVVSLRAVREPRQLCAERRRQQARLHVGEQLVARVGDVEVAHRQLADAVLRREGATRPFPSSAARACR